jgi:predicted transcriptional regulator
MIESVIIEPGLQQQLHLLARETHRTESENIHETHSGYLAADHHYVKVLKQRIAAADLGEFASENEVAIFFDVKCKA